MVVIAHRSRAELRVSVSAQALAQTILMSQVRGLPDL
jgi:hypothetical protein